MTEKAGAVNKYICTAGHIMVTINYCDGTTSYTIECRKTGCGKVAYSQLYAVPQHDLAIVPQFEWRVPTKHEMRAFPKGTLEAVQQHLSMGGLMCYPVSKETLVKYGRANATLSSEALYMHMELNRLITAKEQEKAQQNGTDRATGTPLAVEVLTEGVQET